MTAVMLRIVELHCDGPNCFADHEGHPGQSESVRCAREAGVGRAGSFLAGRRS